MWGHCWKPKIYIPFEQPYNLANRNCVDMAMSTQYSLGPHNKGFLMKKCPPYYGVPRLVQLCRNIEERNNSDAVLVASLAALRKICALCPCPEMTTIDYHQLIKPRLMDSFLMCSHSDENFVWLSDSTHGVLPGLIPKNRIDSISYQPFQDHLSLHTRNSHYRYCHHLWRKQLHIHNFNQKVIVYLLFWLEISVNLQKSSAHNEANFWDNNLSK